VIKPSRLSVVAMCLLAAVYAAIILIPIGGLIRSSLTTASGHFTGSNFSQLKAGGGYYLYSALRTVRIAAEAAVVLGIVGFTVSWYIYTGRSARKLIVLLILMPLFISSTVRTFGWVLVFYPYSGLIADASHGTIGNLTKTDIPMIVAFVGTLLPFVFISCYSTLLRLDRTLVSAAESLGASPSRVLRTVVLPLCWPGLLAGTVLAFIIAATAVDIPVLLGGVGLNTLPAQIYAEYLAVGNFHYGAALSILLVAVVMAVGVLVLVVLPRLVRLVAHLLAGRADLAEVAPPQ
jgi:ABC-type spermidine/putrescine transport system permease subunit I